MIDGSKATREDWRLRRHLIEPHTCTTSCKHPGLKRMNRKPNTPTARLVDTAEEADIQKLMSQEWS